jgi:hypothetical protein
MKKSNVNKKLAGASAMLLLSASMLGTSTYAWFTMNKEVSVTGMQLQAHAEEGLLINEVKLASDGNWDDLAQAAATPVTYVLRPASTGDLSSWWHANSKKSADEAGVDGLSNTVAISNGVYYTDISPANVTDYAAIAAASAQGGVQAETHVYFSDATFGTQDDVYEPGEGFYVNYKYYLKSSSTDNLTVTTGNLKATVTAELVDSTATATKLDNALRVGIKIGNDVTIFAPITGADGGTADTAYKVTTDTAGTPTSSNITANTAQTGVNTAALTIPKVTGDDSGNGLLVDVYVWFEGEDQNCMSDNLTATLNAYKIDISFEDADI